MQRSSVMPRTSGPSQRPNARSAGLVGGPVVTAAGSAGERRVAVDTGRMGAAPLNVGRAAAGAEVVVLAAHGCNVRVALDPRQQTLVDGGHDLGVVDVVRLELALGLLVAGHRCSSGL